MKAAEFKKIREELGLTQDELSEVLCLSGRRVISNIEQGLRNPSLLSIVLMRVFASLSISKSKELQHLILSLREDELGRKGRKS